MLLAVLTCQSATETAQRHWPSWHKYFTSTVFVSPVDSKCWVPEGVQEWRIGRDFYNDRDKPDDNLPRRTSEVLERFLATGHDSICIIEYDVVLFRKPVLRGTFSGTMFGEFIHPPWCFTRAAAMHFVDAGKTLLRHNVITGGWPDRHLRLIYDLVNPETYPTKNYSCNTLDQPHMIAAAREAVKDGAWAVHGIKTKEQFDALTGENLGKPMEPLDGWPTISVDSGFDLP